MVVVDWELASVRVVEELVVGLRNLYKLQPLSSNLGRFFSFPNTLTPTGSNTLESIRAWQRRTAL